MNTGLYSKNIALAARSHLERVTGIEPALSAWEADVLPLNYTRAGLAAVPALGRAGSGRSAIAQTSYRNPPGREVPAGMDPSGHGYPSAPVPHGRLRVGTTFSRFTLTARLAALA